MWSVKPSIIHLSRTRDCGSACGKILHSMCIREDGIYSLDYCILFYGRFVSAPHFCVFLKLFSIGFQILITCFLCNGKLILKSRAVWNIQTTEIQWYAWKLLCNQVHLNYTSLSPDFEYLWLSVNKMKLNSPWKLKLG